MSSEPPDKEASMRSIIAEQFGAELTYKEAELTQIEDRIRLAKLMLQRLRMGVLAQHYGSAGFYPTELDYSQENIGVQSSWDNFEEAAIEGPEVKEEEPIDELNDKDADVSKESTPLESCASEESKISEEVKIKDEPMESEEVVNGTLIDTRDNSMTTPTTTRIQPVCPPPDPPLKSHDQSHDKEELSSDLESRFYRKKRIIVGNTSQFLDPSSQCGGSTHKWMAYVRGSQSEPDISHFVKAVRFFLHPSYHPHDIIVISKPPFHLTKLGWGEFPIRVQLEFADNYNKPADIIHNLMLDRTHTGHQTLGAETVVDLDLSVVTDIGPALAVKQLKERAQNGINPLVNGLDSNLDVSEVREISTTDPNGDAIPVFSDENDIKLNQDDAMEVEEEKEPELLAARCCEYVPKSSRKSDSPVVIQHISLPIERGSNDSIILDHDYCTTVVTIHTSQPSPTPTPSLSRESSVPNSEVSRVKSETSSAQVLTTNLDKCLHVAVRSIPLYGRQSPNDGFLLSASSLAQFQAWAVGRRRASEWMRAVAVKHQVERQLRIPAVLTTKQVVQWCRRNGYTPLDAITNTLDSGFCKYCGCQLRPPQEVPGEDSYSVVSNIHKNCSKRLKQLEHSTLSTSTSTFSEVLTLQDELTRQEHLQELNQELDIETVPTVPSKPSTSSEDTSVPRFRIPQTPELKWIQQTSANIGIRVYPAVIDRMYAHVVEHMIYMSCARFLRSILVQATQEAGNLVEGELCQERVITPRHVHQALRNLESCDFVTDKYLGVDEGGRNFSDSSSSESDSD